MKKRGQLTIFIILGLIILLLVSLFIYFYATTMQIQEGSSQVAYADTQSANILIQSCLDQVTDQGFEILGRQGGYLFLPTGARLQLTETDKFTYLYHNSVDLVPSLTDMEEELEKYININMRYCFDDLQNFRTQQFEVEIGRPKANVNILENNVEIRLNYPLNFKKDEIQFTLKEFGTVKDVNLRKIYIGLFQVIDEAKITEIQIKKDIDKIKDNILSGSTSTFKPEKYVPPRTFERDGLNYKTYWYKDTAITLWMISDNGFNFKFATKLFIEE